MINNSFTIKKVKACNNDEANNLLNNGWYILGTSATIGDNPQFLLVKNNNIIETDYGNFHHHLER